jgi:hypothetical protein
MIPPTDQTPTMSLLRILLPVVMASTLTVCGAPPSSNSPSVVEADSSGVSLMTVRGSIDALPRWTVDSIPTFQVRGDEAPFLSDVGEVAVASDGRLIVEDNQAAEVWVFEPSTDPVALGARGDGPGEFRNVVSITVGRADSIFVFDRRQARMTVFHSTGTLSEVIDLPRGVEGEGTFLVSAWPVGDHVLLQSIRFSEPADLTTGMRLGSPESTLRLADRDGRPSDQAARFAAGLALMNQRFDGRSPFSADPSIAVRDTLLVHGRGAGYTLEHRTPDLRLRRSTRWPGRRRALTPAEVDYERSVVEARFTSAGRAQPERIEALLDEMFAPQVVPDELPALGPIHIDDIGRVWVQSFRLRTAAWQQEHAWHVLRPSGRPLAQLVLPPETRLAAVHDDHVVLVSRDALEVQQIGVYAVNRSSGR